MSSVVQLLLTFCVKGSSITPHCFVYLEQHMYSTSVIIGSFDIVTAVPMAKPSLDCSGRNWQSTVGQYWDLGCKTVVLEDVSIIMCDILAVKIFKFMVEFMKNMLHI